MDIRKLDPDEFSELATALGDTPETVASVHVLRKGLCKAFVAGTVRAFEAAVVQDIFDPEEPMGFGENAEATRELLLLAEGWECVDVNAGLAEDLGGMLMQHDGIKVRYYDDVYYTLMKPAQQFESDVARALTLADASLIAAAPAEIQGAGYDDTRQMLNDGVVAGAVDSGRLVSIAHTSGESELHCEIGVGTLKAWRGRGYGIAVSSIVAAGVQETGRIPVWSTGADNIGSKRIAEKIGFREVSRRKYVIKKPEDGS
jgi:hypothetical protein